MAEWSDVLKSPALVYDASPDTMERLAAAGFTNIVSLESESESDLSAPWYKIQQMTTDNLFTVFHGSVEMHPAFNAIVEDFFNGTDTDFDVIFMGNQLDYQTDSYIVRMPTAKIFAYIVTTAGAAKLLAKFPNGCSAADLYRVMQEEPLTFSWYCWNGTNFPCDCGEETDTGLVFRLPKNDCA